MYLSRLNLENYRSYRTLDLSLDKNINLIVGNNGAGKTNILEAIFLLSSGKSFRNHTLSQLINWNSQYSIVQGNVSDHHLEVQLIKEPGKLSTTRKFLIDQVAKTRPKYLGVFKTVVFEPEDIRLVAGSPSRRREYLDSVFTSTEWRYLSALSQYHRALKHRNELLDLIREGRSTQSELFYWDQSLIKNSSIVTDYRQKYINSINTYFQTHPNSELNQFFLVYRPSIITQAKLDSGYKSDLVSGYTQLGPHRDDFSFNSLVFSATDKNLAYWGSRGQQRLAVLALRLAQINFIESAYQDTPVLLLDDIFSEFDDDHRRLISGVCHKYQTLFTSADTNFFEYFPDLQPKVIKVGQ